MSSIFHILTIRDRENNPFLGESHGHGLQHVDRLTGAFRARENLLDNLPLVRAITRQPIKEPTHLQSLPSDNRTRTAEDGPALLGLEGLHGSQLVEHSHGQTQHIAVQVGIHHRVGIDILHAFDLEGVGIAEHNALPQGFAFSDRRRTGLIGGLLLLHPGGLGLTVLGAAVQTATLLRGHRKGARRGGVERGGC